MSTAVEPRSAWERQQRETARAYALFREFRDLGPTRNVDRVVDAHADVRESTLRGYAARHSWTVRAVAWDDEVARLDDERRLQAIRDMHSTHSQAARLALQLALRGMRTVDPAEMTATDVARLLELGARLERDTLTISVEELQGRPAHGDNVDDPWNAIARELAPPS